MKQMILMIALMGTTGFAVSAQTNRSYYSGMQTQQILEDERRGGTPSNNTVRLSLGTETIAEENVADNTANMQMNTVQQHQGYRMNAVQGYYGGSAMPGPDEQQNNSGYDTSRNNGKCLGCGSGAITDHRRWLMDR